MKILGIDSSGMTATVAVVDETRVLAEYSTNFKKTHSQTLLPMLGEITKMIELNLNSVDAIAVAAGPGSFTGLRIGSATAKGLGLALDKPLVAVPTLDGMAYNFCASDRLICPMMDARRNQVYTGLYRFDGDKLLTIAPQMAVPVEEMIEIVNAKQMPVVFMGDGSIVYRAVLEEKTTVSYMFAPSHLNQQRAAAVAALGMQYFKEGKIQTAAEHAPDYLRLSQAERERAVKENGKR